MGDSRISLMKQTTSASSDSLESLQPVQEQGTSLQPLRDMVRQPNSAQDKTPKPVDKSVEPFRNKCHDFRNQNQNVMASRVADATNAEGTTVMDERRRIRLNRRANLDPLRR